MNDNDRTNYIPSFNTTQRPSRRKGLLHFLKCIPVPQEHNTRGGVCWNCAKIEGRGDGDTYDTPSPVLIIWSPIPLGMPIIISIPKGLVWRIAVLPNEFSVPDGVGLSCVVAVLSNRRGPGTERRTYVELVMLQCGRYIRPHGPILRALQLWALHDRVGI